MPHRICGVVGIWPRTDFENRQTHCFECPLDCVAENAIGVNARPPAAVRHHRLHRSVIDERTLAVILYRDHGHAVIGGYDDTSIAVHGLPGILVVVSVVIGETWHLPIEG